MARAIDVDKAMEVAQIKYNDWNLAMAAADGQREINLCFKKQELFKAVKAVLECVPTLTPPNEPMLERVAREYLNICGEDCVGDPSVGIPECPFFHYADVLDNGGLIQPKCELAAYRS